MNYILIFVSLITASYFGIHAFNFSYDFKIETSKYRSVVTLGILMSNLLFWVSVVEVI